MAVCAARISVMTQSQKNSGVFDTKYRNVDEVSGGKLLKFDIYIYIDKIKWLLIAIYRPPQGFFWEKYEKHRAILYKIRKLLDNW